MAKYSYKAVLTKDSMDNLAKSLLDYKNKILADKCKLFVERLAQKGIKTATQNKGKLGNYISFTMKTDVKACGCSTIVYARDTQTILREWLQKDGTTSKAEISPLLMTEFGSGKYAQNPKDIPDVGQGSFPGQKHADDPNGWSWQDVNGNWHHSSGMEAHMPMFKASQTIITECKITAKEVFG